RRLRHPGQSAPGLAARHDPRALRAPAGLVSVEPDAERRRGADATRLLSRRLAAAHPKARIRRLRRGDARGLRALRRRHSHQHRQRLRASSPRSGRRGFDAPPFLSPPSRERRMSPYDLTNLTALKAWLGLPQSAGPNDATLSALITAASRMIYSALGRPGL